jgi:hypothetical protein
MAQYDYACDNCFLIIPKDYPFGKPKRKIKCPECRKLCNQHFAGRDIPVHFKGAGWTGKNSVTGFNKTGGSDEINKKLQEETKDRMKTGFQHYSVYTPPQKVYDRARKLSDAEVVQKKTAARKVSDHVYNKAKIDPYNKYKPQ